MFNLLTLMAFFVTSLALVLLPNRRKFGVSFAISAEGMG